MVTTLDSGQRKARKKWHCGMCLATISPGGYYAFQVNVYDGRVYTWRECLPCDRDNVVTYVHDWTGGCRDEGVDYESAIEWAEEAVMWPRNWFRPGRPIHPAERLAARDFLARATAGYDLRADARRAAFMSDFDWPALTADTLRAQLLATSKADDADKLARLLADRPELADLSLAAEVRAAGMESA